MSNTKTGNEGNLRMLQNHSHSGHGDGIRLATAMDTSSNESPPRNHTDAITLGETPSSRMANECSESQDGEHLTSIKPGKCLQQFPHMTESIESIEPFIRPPWWTLKAKTRMEKTKDIAKNAHDKTQELPDAKVPQYTQTALESTRK